MINDISVLLVCLNEEKYIAGCLESMLRSNLKEIIVIDGGSSDNTFEVASKSPVKVIKSQKGMLTQMQAGLQVAKGSLILIGEADHLYPENSINKLADELIEHDADGIQGQLQFKGKNNFFEKGHKEFLRIHLLKNGPRDMISGSQIWKVDKLKGLLENVNGGQNYSFDTERAEAIKRLGLNTYVGKTLFIDSGEVNFKKFIRRHINYGFGDYEFYVANKSNFNFLRKIKSLTHVMRQYFFVYPIKGLLHKRFFIIIPYLWSVGFVRYFGFFLALLGIKPKFIV